MKVPPKVLYANYLPKVKDRNKILMADSGLMVDNGLPPRKNLLSSIPDEYLDNLDNMGKMSNPNDSSINTNNFQQPNVNPTLRSGDPQQFLNNGLSPNQGNYNTNFNVSGNAPTLTPLQLNLPPDQKKKQPYNGEVGQGILTAASAVDALLPYGKIKRWPTVRPQVVANQHPYGTGSQALMDQGGVISKSGIHIKPSHKGRFTAYKKRTGQTTEQALHSKNPHVRQMANFARNAKKWKHEDGGVLEMPAGGGIPTPGVSPALNSPTGLSGNMYGRVPSHVNAGPTVLKHKRLKFPDGGVVQPIKRKASAPQPYGNRYVAFPYGNGTGMPTTNTIDLNSKRQVPSPNERGFVNSYNAIDANGIKQSLTDEQIPYQYLTGRNTNNFAVQDAYNNHTDSVYVAPGAEKFSVHLRDGGPVGSGPVTFPASHLSATWDGKKFTYPPTPERPHNTFKSGGSLKPSKAAEILHDGTANGHKLTDKQRRFMGWKAGQKAPGGITIPNTGTKTLPYTPQSRTDAYLVDDINQELTTGVRTHNTGYAPEQQQMLNDAYLWRQGNTRQNPQDYIQGYFNRPVNPNNPNEAYRAKLNTIGYGAGAMYNTTPNMDVRNPSTPSTIPSVAHMEHGGMMAENDRLWRTYKSGGHLMDSNVWAYGGYAEGGEIDTHWGGNAEPIAYNPYDGGTTEFHGPSHADGGIGMSYNDNHVEVEGGETAAKDQNGNLNVFGNMYIPGTRTKFKSAVKEIGEKEQHFDKLKTSGTNTVNSLDPKNKYDQIKFNAAELMMKGGDMGQQELAKRKQQLADLQNSMLDTAERMNVDPQGMSQGNFKKAKKGMFVKKYADGGPIKIPKVIPDDWVGNDPSDVGNFANTGDPNDPVRADRNNSPGNIRMPNKKSYKNLISDNGRIPLKADKDGFLIFPNRQEGSDAMTRLLHSPTYKNLPIDDAIKTWTGQDPYKYTLPDELKGKKINDLNDNQIETLKGIMAHGEGSRYGVVPANPNTVPLQTNPNTGTPISINPTTPIGLPSAPPFTVDTPTTKPATENPPNYSLGPVSPKKDIPTQAKPLGFNDVASDIFAIAQNQERPVYAQRYTPQLYQPYQISEQDRINQNQESFNDIKRLVNPANPTALGSLAAQKYSADNQVRADEFRTNQGISNQVYNQNVGLSNQAQMTNLGIAANQFKDQDLANSKTREANQLIVNDLSSKYSAVEARNNELRAYENLYNFRLQPNDKTGGLDETNYNPDAQFNYNHQGGGGDTDNNRRTTVYNPNGTVKNYRDTKDSELVNNYRELRNEMMKRKLDPNNAENLKFLNGGKLALLPAPKLFRGGYIKQI